MADTSGGAFVPFIQLYSPSGTYIVGGSGPTVGAIANTILSTSGTYTVVVSDSSGNHDQTGGYNLYFIKAPGANELGTLGNGSNRSETMDLGDLDSYTFNASSGGNIKITVTNTSGSAFVPFVQLYSPSGTYIVGGSGPTVGVITNTVLTTTGTYTVVVSDSSGNHDQTGAYTLQLKGTGINSVDNPGAGTGSGSGSAGNSSQAVPIPSWAITFLGAGLLAVSIKLRRK